MVNVVKYWWGWKKHDHTDIHLKALVENKVLKIIILNRLQSFSSAEHIMFGNARAALWYIVSIIMDILDVFCTVEFANVYAAFWK